MAQRLSAQDHLFVLTGAGVSAESGLPTFRGVNGIWRGYRVEDVATPEAFAADPALVWQFYSERRKRHETVKPNPAHFALAELERSLSERFFLCTQNVDSLHEQAWIETRRSHAWQDHAIALFESDIASTAPFDDRNLYQSAEEIPKCRACGAPIRPHICWFGEVPFHMELILHQLEGATVLLTVGTSGVVEPAASFVRMARRNGAQTIYVGPEEPSNLAYFDEVLLGKAGQVLPGLVEDVIGLGK